MAGGPSHLETLDYKPKLATMHGQPMPDSFTDGSRSRSFRGRSSSASHRSTRSRSSASRARNLRDLPADRRDRRRDLHHPLDGDRGDQPRPRAHVHEHRHDDLRPAGMGSWINYGLGSESQDLPGFVVLTSLGKFGQAQPLSAAAVA